MNLKNIAFASISLVQILFASGAVAAERFTFSNAKGPIVNVVVTDTEVTFSALANGWFDFSRQLKGLSDLGFNQVGAMALVFPKALCRRAPGPQGFPLIECEDYYGASFGGAPVSKHAAIVLNPGEPSAFRLEPEVANSKGIVVDEIRVAVGARQTLGVDRKINEALVEVDSFFEKPAGPGVAVGHEFVYPVR